MSEPILRWTQRAGVQLRKGLQLCSVIADKIPQRTDSPLQVLVKSLAIVDTVRGMSSRAPELDALIRNLDLVPESSKVMARIFFGTRLRDDFEVRTITIGGETFIEATNAQKEVLLFRQPFENHYDSKFYISRGVDLGSLLQRLWEQYDGHLYVEYGYGKSEFAQFAPISNPLYGSTQARLDATITRHRRYSLDHVARAYMFHGKPGTGKTSFAQVFAERVGSRIMKLSADSFVFIGIADINFLVEALKPDFIIVDDVDKVGANSSLPTLLDAIQQLKTAAPDTSLLLTANTVDKFDEGFFRPGRIDTWMLFDPPGLGEREAILAGYCKELNIFPESETVRNLAEASEGLTQDYLREIALRLKYEEVDEIAAALRNMHRLLVPKDLPRSPEAVNPESESGSNGVGSTPATTLVR